MVLSSGPHQRSAKPRHAKSNEGGDICLRMGVHSMRDPTVHKLVTLHCFYADHYYGNRRGIPRQPCGCDNWG